MHHWIGYPSVGSARVRLGEGVGYTVKKINKWVVKYYERYSWLSIRPIPYEYAIPGHMEMFHDSFLTVYTWLPVILQIQGL